MPPADLVRIEVRDFRRQSISGLFVQARYLLALMSFADPRLILSDGFMLGRPFRLGGLRSYLLTITSCRTWYNLSGISPLFKCRKSSKPI